MNLVDSCGWIEFFADGPNSEVFSLPLAELTNVLVPTVCLHEVYRLIHSHAGRAAALRAIAHMKQGRVVGLTAGLSLAAAGIRLERKFSMADSIILATAQHWDGVLWTQDSDFAGCIGVEYVPYRGRN